MGVYILGLFVCYSEYDQKDGSTVYAITIATDTDAYRVYMDNKTDPALITELEVGVPIRVMCRPYVKRNGSLAWGGGHDLRQGE